MSNISEIKSHLGDLAGRVEDLRRDGAEQEALALLGQRYNAFTATIPPLAGKPEEKTLTHLASIINTVAMTYAGDDAPKEIDTTHRELVEASYGLFQDILGDVEQDQALTVERVQAASDLLIKLAMAPGLKRATKLSQDDADSLIDSLLD